MRPYAGGGTRAAFRSHPCRPRSDRFYASKAAATAAVREVLYRYRPGATLTDDDAAFVLDLVERHPDSDPSFEELLDCFLASERVELGAVEVQPTCDGETMTLLADRALGGAWSAYHRARARLRLVSRYANLSLLRRARGG